MKVLIIDDEKDICLLLKMLLRQRNYESVLANSIGEAEGVLHQLKPDLIFLDNNLPDGLGINYINDIRNVHPEAKIIMITAHDSPTERDKAISRGADEFIGKPFSREKIFTTIDAISA